MRDRRERVNGPYRHGKRWRIVVIGAASESHRSTHSFETETEAREFKRELEKQITGRTVTSVVEEYRVHLAQRVADHEIKDCTAEREWYHLRRLLKLSSEGHRLISKITPALARELYDDSKGKLLRKDTKKNAAVDTHRNGLAAGKAFGNWCVSVGYLKVNPFAAVKGKGKRKHGKEKLGTDDAGAVYHLALELGAGGDVGAIVVVSYLVLGARANELLTRRVRELDAKGTQIRVPETKSEAGKRSIRLPIELQPLYAKLAAGRPKDGYLFEHAMTRARPRDWALEQVRRICKLAGVPVITTHGLRGTQGTIAADAGATSELVAATLGNTPTIAERAYINKEAREAATARKALVVLKGGKAA